MDRGCPWHAERTHWASVRVCSIGNTFSGFYTFRGSVVFPLLVFNKLLEPDKRLKLKMDSIVRYSDVRDGFTGRYCNGPAVCAVFCDGACWNVFRCAAVTVSVVWAVYSLRLFPIRTKKKRRMRSPRCLCLSRFNFWSSPSISLCLGTISSPQGLQWWQHGGTRCCVCSAAEFGVLKWWKLIML